jgi:hypothetical protein
VGKSHYDLECLHIVSPSRRDKGMPVRLKHRVSAFPWVYSRVWRGRKMKCRAAVSAHTCQRMPGPGTSPGKEERYNYSRKKVAYFVFGFFFRFRVQSLASGLPRLGLSLARGGRTRSERSCSGDQGSFLPAGFLAPGRLVPGLR